LQKLISREIKHGTQDEEDINKPRESSGFGGEKNWKGNIRSLYTEDVGNWMIFVFLSTFSKCSVCLGSINILLLSNFEQPERNKLLRELIPNMTFRLRTSFLQLFKFKLLSSLRIPIDGIWRSSIHP